IVTNRMHRSRRPRGSQWTVTTDGCGDTNCYPTEATDCDLNPYSPTGNLPTTASIRAAKFLQGRPAATLFACTSIVAMVYLLQYLLLDWFTVRVWPYPERATKHDWLLLLFPVLPSITLLLLRCTRLLAPSGGAIVAAWFLGTILSVPLVFTVGIWFHFAIGGTL
ncbi:MAG: hypothetical protein WBD31_26555, partial [Rubripirellula sp.]